MTGKHYHEIQLGSSGTQHAKIPCECCDELRAEVERLRELGNAVIDSCEIWSWLLENGGMLPNTGYLNMTVKLGQLWELAQALGRDKL